jgi:hypothetical protein
LFGHDNVDTAVDGDTAGDGALAALLEKAGARLDTAGDEDRQEMIDLMETIRDAQTCGDAATLAQARTQLSDLLFYLET